MIISTFNKLEIIIIQNFINLNNKFFFFYFKDTIQDVYIYIRYIETNQIERKSLLKQVRSIEDISINALLFIRYKIKSNNYA